MTRKRMTEERLREIESKFPRSECSEQFYADICWLIDELKTCKKAYGKLFNEKCKLEGTYMAEHLQKCEKEDQGRALIRQPKLLVRIKKLEKVLEITRKYIYGGASADDLEQAIKECNVNNS
jgi:hypothetical protein